MKKNLFLVAGMFFCASTFIGCSNEENLTSSNEFTVKATMGVESRTELGNDYATVTWCADDQIYLFGEGANATMRLMSGAGKNVAVFSGIVNGFPYKLNKALYPVPTIENGEYSYTLPAEKDYSANSGAPLYGPYQNGMIQYQNLVAMMRVPLSASANDRVLELSMEGIAGKLIVDVENGTATMEAGATDKVTVNVPAGEACFIDIPVPAKTYTTGYTVTVDGNVIAQETGSVELGVNAVKVILNEPVIDENTSKYQIATTADLLWVAKQVNTGADTFVGKTLVMTDDIDLTGINWTPIGINNEICFKGTFDGQDHTISNLSVAVEGTASAGLFANGAGATIKNLTLENVNVNGNYMTGVVMGDGSCATILNCHVNGGSVTSIPHLVGGKYDDGNHAGGIVGYLAADGGNASVTGCSVTGLVITAYRDVAGIAGTASGAGFTPTISDNEVSNTTIIADQTVDYVEVKAANAGEIVGRKAVEPTMSGNTVGEGVIVKAYVKEAKSMAQTLTNSAQNIEVILMNDIDLPISSLGTMTGGSGEYKLGGEDTKNITIDLNKNKLNITTTYWSAIGAKNENATFTIRNGEMTSSQPTGTWNSYDLRLANCNYVIEDVVFNKAVALTSENKSITMTGVTINETHAYYALWIQAKGQNVVINGLTVNSGRGIKIDEQYVATPTKVTLNVSNADFNTNEKAAIMVKSAAGADIILNNIDISEVQGDHLYAVWVDEDSAAYYDLVTITGGKKKQE